VVYDTLLLWAKLKESATLGYLCGVARHFIVGFITRKGSHRIGIGTPMQTGAFGFEHQA
jgi:hypothetical protein